MDELKASPVVNPRMAKLAELLRKGKEFGNRAQIPESVPLLGGQGLGDMLLGEAPEEVENWGYGNYPVKIPEMSNVPQISDKRKQGVADALLAAPFAGGGVTEAAMLPARKKLTKHYDDWSERGLWPYKYTDLRRQTPKIMAQITQNAPIDAVDRALYRTVLDPEQQEYLTKLRGGDIYEPKRLLSTTADPDAMGEIEEALMEAMNFESPMRINIRVPAGVKAGGEIPPSNAGYGKFNEYLLRPDIALEKQADGSFVTLTESEANLKRRLAKLREKK